MIYLVADHGGFALKQRLEKWLAQDGYQVLDLGPLKKEAGDDYPPRAARLARALQKKPSARGIAICRSGVGMAIVANKFAGIRATQAWTPTLAAQSRRDEDTNVLSLAADYQSWPQIIRVVKSWLETPYRPQQRFTRRLKEIKAIEHGR